MSNYVTSLVYCSPTKFEPKLEETHFYKEIKEVKVHIVKVSLISMPNNLDMEGVKSTARKSMTTRLIFYFLLSSIC